MTMKIILLSFLLSYYFIYFTLVSAKCLEDQQSLLLQFKNNFTFDPQFSTKLTFWNENTACCNWSGVTCDNEGHVIGLDLSFESISGGFNNASSLFSLQYLQKLNLALNNFNSTIPSGFSKLVMLNYLDFSSAGFVGQIPMEISTLTRLVTLNLTSFPSSSKEQMLTINNGNLQTLLQNLTSLRQLYLNYVSISAKGHEWGNALLPLRDLQELSMSFCDLSGPIDSSITKLVNLSVIILDGNNLSSSVPETFANFKKLTTLRLSNCGLIGTFPQKIFQIETLSVIDLSGNYNLHGLFLNSLLNLTHLTSLKLSDNNLSGQISHSLSNLTHLTSLDLSNNNLSGQIPLSLFTLQSLEMIDLSSNRLNGSLQLDDVLKLRSLTRLALSHNNISIDENVANVDLSLIPDFTHLRLASCNLKSFPSFLINQSSLTYLDLSNNQIQGEIPYWISRLHDLQSLMLSHNKLRGSIPAFPKLAYFLDYSYNNFSVVPQDVDNNLSSLYFLSFSNNNLHGRIPKYLCNASPLEVLDISFNSFSGTIPPCLITMTNYLEALNMRNNILTGPIPDIFPDSFALKRLNLHGNLLHGSIPKSLSNCSSLEILDIGSNQIVDRFPCFLNSISTLRVLVLWNNKFHGSIECLHFVENEAWKMIQIMDIAFNNFNGKLPDKYFTTWERMMNDEDDDVDFNQLWDLGDNTYYHDSVAVTCKGQQQEWVNILTIYKAIDFSSNFFEGPIPESLMDLKALYILNFSNNGLTGKIPSSIGNLKQLESLDFSNNSLVGEIPVQLASITFLSYLNLSFNHLVGKIPTGTQLQSFRASSFEGNDGLYGSPLNEIPDGKTKDLHPQPACESLVCSTDLNFLSVELGFVFGLGMIIGPVMFWKKWRVGYWRLADRILCKIFPWMHIEYATERGKTYTVLRW